jgi:hypothetical protein
MDNFETEYEEFLKDTEIGNKHLRLMVDELNSSKYSYSGMKLSDITPVYSNNGIKIHVPEKRCDPSTKLF